LTFQILALIIIAVLVLYPACRGLQGLRRATRAHAGDAPADRLLRQAPRQLLSEIVVLALFLAALAVAVLLHVGPF